MERDAYIKPPVYTFAIGTGGYLLANSGVLTGGVAQKLSDISANVAIIGPFVVLGAVTALDQACARIDRPGNCCKEITIGGLSIISGGMAGTYVGSIVKALPSNLNNFVFKAIEDSSKEMKTICFAVTMATTMLGVLLGGYLGAKNNFSAEKKDLDQKDAALNSVFGATLGGCTTFILASAISALAINLFK